jgi:hypothetical protein
MHLQTVIGKDGSLVAAVESRAADLSSSQRDKGEDLIQRSVLQVRQRKAGARRRQFGH